MTERLPDDLSALDGPELTRARVQRDERLTSLFRRWPRLSRGELRDLRVTYAERIRLARVFGRRSRRAD